jgi:pimeloyl-ACP methyl ester carboxylesterase
MTAIKYRSADVDGVKVFYRESGAADAPALLLLHGFPSASHMFRDLIPLLADRFHIVAPDLPGFGQSDMPARSKFKYTFDHIAAVIDRFTEVIGLKRFAIYVFDYGAPIGFRIAAKHPDRITAIISQNGNAYEEGLSDGWNPIRAYWQEPSQTNRDALRAFLAPEATRWQYTHGVTDGATVSSRWTTSIWRAPVPMRSSWTCSATTRVTSRSTRLSRTTSAPTSRRSSPYGVRTIRSSCLRVPKRSSATFPMRSSASSIPDTSRLKRMPLRSRQPSAISSLADSATLLWRTAVRAIRGAPPYFETHRSALRLWEHLRSRCAAMLLSMRAARVHGAFVAQQPQAVGK